ncbi:hypothetical protein [Commensalibacter sp. Nvir]|uniref:scabin-related ADP-ribosyltransferase n=1 Tax=Commensalibacter sp. Nvir TaxID=3069817 RepID=UPI0030C80172
MFFSLTIPLTFAIEPYDTVYRSDSRDPNAIFITGFHPHGTNLNVEDHVTGWSSGAYAVGASRNSAFISTTTDVDIAIQLLESQIEVGHIIIFMIVDLPRIFILQKKLYIIYPTSSR